MDFFLDLSCGGAPEGPIYLTAGDFAELREAQAVLEAGLAIEENYELLLSNYGDFEKEILLAATDTMLRRQNGYGGRRDLSSNITKRIVNLLTSARMYTDHVQHHVGTILSSNDVGPEGVRILFETQYDGHIEYRFMEALRNYVQHRGLPIHLISIHRWREEPFCPESNFMFTIDVLSSKARLQEEVKFKKGLLQEIGDQVCLKAMARRYVECLNEIHLEVRKRTAKRLEDARDVFKRHISLAKARFGEQYSAFVAYCQEDRGEENTAAGRIPVLLEWDDIRIELAQENGALVNLHRRVVTGESRSTPKGGAPS